MFGRFFIFSDDVFWEVFGKTVDGFVQSPPAIAKHAASSVFFPTGKKIKKMPPVFFQGKINEKVNGIMAASRLCEIGGIRENMTIVKQ